MPNDDSTHQNAVAVVTVAGAAAAMGFGPIDPGALFEQLYPDFIRIVEEGTEQLKAIGGTPEHEAILERRRRGELGFRAAAEEIFALAQRFDLETRTLRPPPDASPASTPKDGASST